MGCACKKSKKSKVASPKNRGIKVARISRKKTAGKTLNVGLSTRGSVAKRLPVGTRIRR